MVTPNTINLNILKQKDVIMKKRFGQISIEYTAVIGFALLMIIPLIVVFFLQSGDLTDKVNMNQANQIGIRLVDAAESVYYIGQPSKTVLKVYMPNHVQKINISNREIVFKIETINGIKEIVRTSSVNITGNLSKENGIQYITVEAKGGYVDIRNR